MIPVGKATGPTYKVAFRRRRKNITNYAKRLELVKKGVPRLVVRKSAKGILVQFAEFSPQGDRIIASVHSNSLSRYGWLPRCNSPTAYLCGLLCGKMASGKGVKEFILDIGMQTPSKGSNVFAALVGARDAKLSTNYQKEMISEERIAGKMIEDYAKALKDSDKEKYEKTFSAYLKHGIQPEKITSLFYETKRKIENEKV